MPPNDLAPKPIILMIIFSILKEFFVTVFRYREYLKQSVARDLRKKYKRSALGYLWSMLQPLFMMIILTLVFSNIMKSQVHNYAVFLFAAMVPWAFFDQTCNHCLGIIRSNARIIDQMPIPKFIFPVAIALYYLVNFFLTLAPLFLVMAVTGQPFSWTLILIPIVLIPLFAFTLGVALLLAVLNIFFDDTQHLTQILFRALYFVCPILYGREQIPEWLVNWIALNPMFTIIEDMRMIIYNGQIPDLTSFGYSCVGSLVALILGLYVFKKTSDKFIYFI